MEITSYEQIQNLKNSIINNMFRSYTSLQKTLDTNDVMQIFSSIKFKKTAFDPVQGTPLNFIEMLNQAFSDLVVLYGVDNLLTKYPKQTFIIKLGEQNGYDIESKDGKIVGECFSVVKAGNNGKLLKDTKKLLTLDPNIEKYIFFYSEYDTDDTIANFAKKHPEITYIRIKKFES